MGLLDGKRLLITGVITDASIAFSVGPARAGAGRAGRAHRLRPDVAGRAGRAASCPSRRRSSSWTSPTRSSSTRSPTGSASTSTALDGVLHSIGFAPASCLGGDFLDAPWDDVATAMQVSAYSLKSLAVATLPLFGEAGGSIVGLDFDARVAWPAYDWMGVAKAGARVDRRATWPASSARARSGSTSSRPARSARWRPRASPASPRSRTPGTAARRSAGTTSDADAGRAQHASALLSDWFPATTGEMIHVDGGFHAMGV